MLTLYYSMSVLGYVQHDDCAAKSMLTLYYSMSVLGDDCAAKSMLTLYYSMSVLGYVQHDNYAAKSMLKPFTTACSPGLNVQHDNCLQTAC